MNAKKLFALLLAVVMVLGVFAACGNDKPDETQAPETQPTETQPVTEPESDPAETPAPETQAPSADVTDAPETDPETEAPKKGCGSSVALGSAVLLSAMAAAVALKKKD